MKQTIEIERPDGKKNYEQTRFICNYLLFSLGKPWDYHHYIDSF